MKNKILICVLGFVLLCPALYAKEKDTARLITGIVLTAAGGLMAYNGFQLADASFPSVSVQSFATVTAGTVITVNGVIKNTGNVDLKNVVMNVYFSDNLGNPITSTAVNLGGTLAPNATGQLLIPATDIGAVPEFFSVKYSADYDQKLENFSVPTGIAGSAVFAAGVFLICDYFFDITDFLDEHGAKVQLSAANNGFSLMASKSF